jgi:hypothetical protein
MNPIRIFISFDIEHDGELYDLLLAQSRTATSGFAVAGASERSIAGEVPSEKVRRQIREADQMIVLCGEHTDASTRVGSELRIAREEGTPHFLVWGRRELMCVKPVGAASGEGMFSWTRQILQDQIELIARNARAEATAEALRRSKRRPGPSAVAP